MFQIFRCIALPAWLLQCCRRKWLYGTLLLFFLLPAVGSIAEGFTENELRILDEAVETIHNYALPPLNSTHGMLETVLRSSLQSIDEYSSYLSPKEFKAFTTAQHQDYSGVQMDIREQKKRIYLYPFKNGMAEKAGLLPGDELIAVDNQLVYGQSVYMVGSRIRGEEGTVVQLTVQSDHKILRSVSLRREHSSYQSIRSISFPQALYVRITRFTANTDNEFAVILDQEYEDHQAIIIDLRQNQGGDLRVANRCMELFIERGTPMYTLVTGQGKFPIISQAALRPAHGNILILQDKNTASAAEIFIAALTENDKASSAGKPSYGKGRAQKIFPLSNGAALLLTYAKILTPRGNVFDHHGLAPHRTLPEHLMQADYSDPEKITELLNFMHNNH
ncbi:S41 family peptidase [Desulfogranum japonicum]|uniref:S41 family peptidase n=1 Tax=Desulfogranum japonicum TaxID=231447 RepID=UPI00048B03AE|nr:S41 family peptidase [Desulfogranum japonicum]